MTEGVRVIKISPDNTKLLVVTCDEHNSVYIFNLLNQVLITSARGDSSLIMDATWVNNSTFCTVGIKHFKRWELK
jgi:isopentenyldiphosphate isomerase